MDFKTINDNSIIICPNDLKQILIKESNKNPEIRVKFFSKEEILDNVYFTYDDNAIVYLMKNGNSYSNAKEILDNLKGIKKGNKKLDSLYEIYENLLKNDLLKKDFIFSNLFINKNVYVMGYSSLDSELKYALENILGIKYELIEDGQGSLRPNVYEFETMEEEVNNFFNQIALLTKKGISLNDIYLYSYPSEYDLILRKYAKMYDLPIEFKLDMTLNESPVYKKYISLLNEGNSFEEAFELLDVKYEDFGASTKLVSVLNDVLNLKDEQFDKLQYLQERASRTKLKAPRYDNSIKIISTNFRVDGYVFMLGFSLGSYPSISKDIDLLSDKEKEILHKNTSVITNRINLESLTNYVTSQDNLYISRKTKEGKEEKYDSQVTKKLNLNKVRLELTNIRFNTKLAEMEISKYIDTNKNYGVDHRFLNGLDKDEIKYATYNHSFKMDPIFSKADKMTLSYSAINDYYQCPFAYFIKRMCVKGDFEETFYTHLGTLFHKILEDSLTKEIVLDDYEDDIDKMFVTAKDKFFIKLLEPQVLAVISKNQEFLKYTKFTKAVAEKELSYRIDEETFLHGFMDKVLINEDDKEVMIIDYKTGSLYFNKDKVPLGLGLQLPTYGLLMRNVYPDYAHAGIYIQRICEKEPNEKSYLLDGITLDDPNLFKRIDKGFDGKSIYVKGIGVKKDGSTRKSSSIITKADYDKLLLDGERVIKEAINKIRQGIFNVNPTLLNGNEYACTNCKLGAICFHDEKDYRRVFTNKEKEEEE